MKLLLGLTLRESWHHRARLALCVLATVAMSCLIVWFVGSLDLMMVRFDEDAENYLGHYHLALLPASDEASIGMPPAILEQLEANELVVDVASARQIRGVMGKMRHANDGLAAVRRQRSITGLPMQSPAVIAIDCKESPFELIAGRWFDEPPNTSTQNHEYLEGVMGTGAAAALQEYGDEKIATIAIGDTVICRVGTNDYKIRIVGLFEQKLASAGRGAPDPVAGAVFVSPATADQIQPRSSGKIDSIYVRLREGADTKQFKANWMAHFQGQGLSLHFLDVDDVQEKLNKIRAQDTGALLGGVASQSSILFISSLVSAFIVFTTLSMGVRERTRVFAMLRTIGMSRRGVAALVFGESVILGLLGWLGGTLAGWFVLQMTVWVQPDFYGAGKTVTLGMQPWLTAGASALLGSLLAAILPAWRVVRINPLEGMNRAVFHVVRRRIFVRLAMSGVALLTVAPLVIYSSPIEAGAELRPLLYMAAGLPLQALGFLLLMPFIFLCVEKLCTPSVVWLLKLPPSLLKSQLNSNLWATLGTTAAICVGLGVYSFMEIAGYSMLVPYTPSKMLPHTVAAVLPHGVPSDKIGLVQTLPGVDRERFLPLAVDQALFSQRQTELFLKRGLAKMQASAVMFGLDVEKAFKKPDDGSRALVEVDFKEGTLDSAVERMKSGDRFCLVPDSFALRAGLHVGDKLELLLPGLDDKMVEYEICGVVSMPGWLWMNKTSGVRKRGFRSGAMLLASHDTIKQDFQLAHTEFFWFDRILDSSGKPRVSDAELEELLQRLADRIYATNTEENDGKSGISRPMVKISSREYLTGQVRDRADEVIQAAAKMPLIMLVISSLALLGTTASSVRARRYEFGVLRSLGMTRSELARLILAEGLLVSLTAMVLSLGFGVFGGWCFIGLMRYLSIFGGFTSPLVIPWYRLFTGLAVTLFLCLLAALGPAVAAGRTEPSTLLQER